MKRTDASHQRRTADPTQGRVTPAQALAEAQRQFAAGNHAGAEEICRRIVAEAPAFHAAWFQLGLIAVEMDKLEAALDLMAKAAGIDPSVAAYSRALCEVCRRLKLLDRAFGYGRAAVALAPGDAEARCNFGLALADAGRHKQAAEQYRAALTAVPAHMSAANNLGKALEKLGDEAGAIEVYTRAIGFNPANAEAQNNLGALQSSRGLLDEARASFEAAVAAAPYFALAHHNLSTLKTYTHGDAQLAALEAMAPKAGELAVQPRIRFWFALGKAREDVGRFDLAFDAYRRGNTLARGTFTYDEKGLRGIAQDIKKRFTQEFFDARRAAGAGFSDETPVFIVGMPRSGSTLIEQILSSHPAVHGAGEISDFDAAVTEVLGPEDGRPPMDRLREAPAGAFTRIGENYLARLRRGGVTASRITDKMNGNFFYLGLIRLCLPGAKIVHAARNPMDMCFSNYSRLFNEPMPFAYDLRELGHYYSLHRSLMDHWKRILPEGSFLETRYEDVVEDVEKQAKRLVAHCGLGWDDACLRFHENRRPVRTASVAQVRRPIYASSVMRWENFKSQLGPLRGAIDEEPWKI